MQHTVAICGELAIEITTDCYGAVRYVTLGYGGIRPLHMLCY